MQMHNAVYIQVFERSNKNINPAICHKILNFCICIGPSYDNLHNKTEVPRLLGDNLHIPIGDFKTTRATVRGRNLILNGQRLEKGPKNTYKLPKKQYFCILG